MILKKFINKMTSSHNFTASYFMSMSFAAFALMLFSLQAKEHKLLDHYILEGLKNNPALQRELADKEISNISKKELLGNFLPDITLHSRYTLSEGGRTIDFPIGDMLNPVYRNLEDLNGAGTSNYPNLENIEINLLPEKDQETKLRLIQPIFNMDIFNGYRAGNSYSEVKASAFNAAVNQLIGKIRSAYFELLQAEKGSEIYRASLIRAEENLRVAEKLKSVGSVTETAVLASKTSLLKVQQQSDKAEKIQKQAREYFNMILNRDLKTEVTTLPSDTLFNSYRFVLDYEKMERSELEKLAMKNRYETHSLHSLKETMEHSESLEKGRYFPTISAVLDAGFQGDDYEFSSETDMISGSVILEWNIFDGAKRKRKIEKAKLETRKVESSIEELTLAIKFEIEKAGDDLSVAQKSYAVAVQRAETAERYLNEVKKRYIIGAESYNNLIQAETDFTQADMNMNITEFQILKAASNLLTALGINDYYIRQRNN